MPDRIILDGVPVDFISNDTVLIAMLRAGQVIGGCLCLAGDCPHCLVTVDGVAYVRSCQVKARPGMVIERHTAGGLPPLPMTMRQEPPVEARTLHCDVVVIGEGEAGMAAAVEARAAGRQVFTLDAANGHEVIGVYPGPLVVARTDNGMLHVRPKDEIVIATGAAELHPVAPGNDLAGILTARAASLLAKAGIDLGRVVAIGASPEGIDAQRIDGEILRFEGESRVRAVVVQTPAGERRVECDTVSIGLGLQPRDQLMRMGADLNCRVIGDAARESDLPPCPKAGTVCHCAGVVVDDLVSVCERGFTELELVKRATLAGTGACQGSTCIPHLRSFLAANGRELQPPFTARPVTRQLTLGEAAAGAHHHATPRTPLDAEHQRLGAQMERMGGWWRPWNYGDVDREYWAVREAVSLCDVSTLGKMFISGPDAVELLERLYPTKIATLAPGRAKYALLLDDRGYVLDDGMICRDSDTRFTLTFTSGGATMAELWVRDWAESWGLDVRILNQTMSLGAINVTGPLAKELLARAGLEDPPAYLHHRRATVGGIDCRVFRLSFTGEISYELHAAATETARLWAYLLALGRDLGVRPHGLEALLKLRLEKGHLIVGQDTDFDSTPRRLHHEWAVNLNKPDFVGKQAIQRTNKLPLDRQLVGFEMEGPAPSEGAVLWNGNDYAGYLTSSAYSPVLRKSVMLGWLRLFDGELPREVSIDKRAARRVAMPFYDPEGSRARL